MKYRRRLLATSMIGGAIMAFAATPSLAQSAGDETEVDAVVITGSRIVRRDAVAESPILTVGNEELTQAGSTTIEHYLNTLPQVTAGVSSQSNNPSSNGRAFIDLRGLGSGRNVVLIDGRRPMGSTAAGTVDTNTIPAALVERVEVITGGAASTYGADAVSGVVNFILKNNFEGMELDAQYRQTERGDGEEWGANLTIGGNFADGRGNAVFSAGFFERADIYKGARDWSANATNTTTIFPGGTMGWIGTNAPTQATVDAAFGGTNRCVNTGGHAGFGFNPDGSLFCSGVNVPTSPYRMYGYTGPDNWIGKNFAPQIFSYEFEPDNILVLPLERWSLFTRVNYEVNPYFKPYAQALYTNYNALQELAATPASATTGWNVPVTNPFLNAQTRALLAARPTPGAPFAFSKRFNDLGGRTGYNNHDVWQLVAGVQGEFIGTDTWTYDVYASYGRSVLNEIQGGNVRRDRVGQLLGDAAFWSGASAPTVAQQSSLSGGACPNGLNLFGNAPIDPTCAAWISLEAKNLTTIQQNVVEGSITGTAFELPAGPVQVALGASYRELDFNFRPDSGLQPGLVAGFNQQLPTRGFQSWVDVFGEAHIPLLTGLPLIKDLGLTLGYRVSDNSRTGASDSYKANLEWAVNDWARFRGGYQTAIRSPSISELFAPQLNNFPSFNNQDPCDNRLSTTWSVGGSNGAQVRALCAAQSPVAGLTTFTWAGQANSISGGNPDLQPEESSSWTAGVVLRSPFNSGGWTDSLYATIDYWSIELENVIGSVTAATIVQRCFNRDNANPTYSATNEWCQLFQRAQSDGGVINLKQLSRNQAFQNTSGVDITFGVGFGLGGFGDLNFDVLSTWVEKFESQTSTADPMNDFIGTIGSGTGSATPEWRHTINASWALSPVSLVASARYIDSMVHSATVTGGSPISNTGTDSVWYFDLRGTYDLTDRVTLRFGVNNLLDEDPQLYSPNIQSNTDPSTYDVLGRRYFIGINARF